MNFLSSLQFEIIAKTLSVALEVSLSIELKLDRAFLLQIPLSAERDQTSILTHSYLNSALLKKYSIASIVVYRPIRQTHFTYIVT